VLWVRSKSSVASRQVDPAEKRLAVEKPAAAAAPDSSEPVAGLEAARLRCLTALALLCGRDGVDVGRILAEAAHLVPSAMPLPDASCCRIELDGTSYWSSGYREPELRLERPLNIGGVQIGSVIVGVPGQAASHGVDQASAQFLTAAAEILSQMLARRRDRQRLESQTAELTRRQAALEQIRRLGKLGGWEFDAAASAFVFSDEARRIAGLDTDIQTVRQREELIGAFLRMAIDEAVPTRKPISRDLPCVLADGTKRWLQAVGEVEVAGAKLVKAFGILRDVTEEKETQERLSRMANHDPLTGLANRRQMIERLETALLKRGAAGALLLIDLDNFKDVNDSGGHDAGDALLKAFARRLEEAAGRSGFVARLGGDEFVVLLLKEAERTATERWAASLLSRLREPLAVAGRASTVRLSGGLTLFPADGKSASELLKNADLAVYEAKARGRNLLVSYSPEMREESRRRVALCLEVKEALNTNQFLPFYQPKICLKTGKLVGFEALLRWDHPAGLRTPGSMSAAFEVPELSRALCVKMLDGIIADLAAWQARKLPFGRVAFNASSAEFSGFDLVERVLGQLKAFAISPACLGLEVTETVFLGGRSDSIRLTLERLHNAGVEIALDDFGTGYASLTHLQEYPVDVIKIDQSFIRRLITDSASQAITSVVLGLGRSLGMKVVAEGVETAEQAACLKAAGCDQVQGFFFSRPMPASEVPDFLAAWRGAEEIAALKNGAILLGKGTARAA
jgi:diguanylate cyclase (GGDEF)-like protein